MQNNSIENLINLENQSDHLDLLVKPILFDWKYKAKSSLYIKNINPNYSSDLSLEDVTTSISGSPVSPDIHKNVDFVNYEMITDPQDYRGFTYIQNFNGREQQSECSKLLSILNKYQKKLNYFLQVNCKNEVKNYLALSPKKPLNPFSGQLTGKGNLLNLDIQKINMVLQEQGDNILFPAVINLALHLRIGKIIANYYGDRTSLARYDILIIDFSKLLSKVVKYTAEAKYWVDINYLAPNGNVIPLLELQFIYREEPIEYLFKGADYSTKIEAIFSNSMEQNNINLENFLFNNWPESVLQPDSISVKVIDNKELKFITENVVHKILTTNSFNCQEIRRETLKTFKHEYKSKLLTLCMYNKVFNSYLHKFGVKSVNKIKKNSTLLDPVEFTKDLILMPTIQRDSSSVKYVEYSYNRKVEYLIAAIKHHYNKSTNDDSSGDLTSESSSSVRSVYKNQ